jgi:hypothetical protein
MCKGVIYSPALPEEEGDWKGKKTEQISFRLEQ